MEARRRLVRRPSWGVLQRKNNAWNSVQVLVQFLVKITCVKIIRFSSSNFAGLTDWLTLKITQRVQASCSSERILGNPLPPWQRIANERGNDDRDGSIGFHFLLLLLPVLIASYMLYVPSKLASVARRFPFPSYPRSMRMVKKKEGRRRRKINFNHEDIILPSLIWSIYVRPFARIKGGT